jgi:hypothetical protein
MNNQGQPKLSFGGILMQRKIIILAIAIITLSVSVTAVWMWIIYQNNNSDVVEVGNEYIVMAPKLVAQRFIPGPIFCGVNKLASAEFSTQGYRASTGESLVWSMYEYSSSARANKELLKRIKGAEKIVERVPNLDDNSKKVGERVVAIFPPNKNGIKRTSIFETSRSLLYSIAAPSLELALEFEEKK